MELSCPVSYQPSDDKRAGKEEIHWADLFALRCFCSDDAALADLRDSIPGLATLAPSFRLANPLREANNYNQRSDSKNPHLNIH